MKQSDQGGPRPGGAIELDLRAVVPAAVLAIIVLVIVLLNVNGRDDTQVVTQPLGPSPTFAPPATPGPSPTTSPEQATATAEASAGAPDRDQQRQSDLEAVVAALEEYHDVNGEYPSTNGNVQTLCVFPENDAGCALTEFLDPIPQDPNGDPVNSGYFYQSDGQSFAVYGLREADVLTECEDVPQHLAGYASLICVRSPGAPEGTP